MLALRVFRQPPYCFLYWAHDLTPGNIRAIRDKVNRCCTRRRAASPIWTALSRPFSAKVVLFTGLASNASPSSWDAVFLLAAKECEGRYVMGKSFPAEFHKFWEIEELDLYVVIISLCIWIWNTLNMYNFYLKNKGKTKSSIVNLLLSLVIMVALHDCATVGSGEILH